VAQPQMRTSAAPAGQSSAARFGQLTEQWVGRLVAGRGSTPFRLRIALLVTIVFAVVFAVLGAYGVGKRRSSIEATRHAATELLQLQDIRVAVVQADSIASRLYLTGGAEDPAQRQSYATAIDTAATELVEVALQLNLGGEQATAMQSANAGLARYTGLIEQARANNRQGFPVGAAYQRQANAVVNQVVADLRVVEQGQRDAVNDELGAAHRAGGWLALTGWVLVAVVALVGVWLALRFHRLVNVPLALAIVVVVVVLVVASATQGRAVSKADDAVGGSLTTADLVAQARAAAYDAQSQEALTLINRGNGAANEAQWQDSSAVVESALGPACDNGSSGGCDLRRPWSDYVAGHRSIRAADDAGDWDTAVAISLGRASDASRPDADVAAATKPFATFATDSATLVQGSGAAAQASLSSATDGLALMRALVFLAGLLVIVLAFVGIGQRLREYR
jgi:hypothetical protein